MFKQKNMLKKMKMTKENKYKEKENVSDKK